MKSASTSDDGRRDQGSQRRTRVSLHLLVAVLGYLVAFVVAMALDQPFGPVLVATLLTGAVAFALRWRITGQRLSSSADKRVKSERNASSTAAPSESAQSAAAASAAASKTCSAVSGYTD